MASCTSVKKEIFRTCVDILRNKAFYGHIIQQMEKKFVDNRHHIKTMGVGKRKGDYLIKFFINEDFVKDFYEKAKTYNEACRWLQGVVEHEVLHIVFNHLNLKLTDHHRSAIAVDLVVNSNIDKNSLPPGGMFPEDFKFPQNKDAIWYYTHLKDNKKYKDMMANGQLPFGLSGIGSCPKCGKGVKDQGQEGNKCPVCGDGCRKNGAVGSHAMWDEVANDPLMKELMKDLINKAKDLCGKKYGNVPGSVIDQVEKMNQRKKSLVPWNKALRMFAASACESNLDYTLKRVSKRFGTRPGTRKEDVLNLAAGLDTSGSISNKQLAIFLNEIKWIWRNGANVTVYESDVDIQNVYKFRGKFNGEIHGRGGTNLEPVLKETEGKYDALIYFTDFYAPKIETRYRIPTLWILTNDMPEEEFPYKWGKHICIDIEDKY